MPRVEGEINCLKDMEEQPVESALSLGLGRGQTPPWSNVHDCRDRYADPNWYGSSTFLHGSDSVAARKRLKAVADSMLLALLLPAGKMGRQ